MKILFLIDSLLKGGKERQFVQLISELKNRNINIEIVLLNKKIEYDNLSNLDIKIHFLVRKTKKDLTVFWKLFKIYKKFKPSIVHTFDSMTTFYILPIVLFSKVKLINGSIRGYVLKRKRSFRNYYLNKILFIFSNIIIANSYAGLRSFNLEENDKIKCIYNGFDFKRLQKNKNNNIVRNNLKIDTEKIVSMISSFRPPKDNQAYIKSALLVLKKRDDVTFLAIGEGEKLDECKLISKGNPKIIFLDIQDDVESIINISNLGILTSNSEGISNAILEFYAFKKPVIATDRGGTNEIVFNNRTGFLLKDNNLENLASKIEILLDDSNLCKEFGKNGYELINQNFSLDKMVNSYYELYKSLI